MTDKQSDVPELPSNVCHIVRRIRACESEVPAQLVLEHALHSHARTAVAAALAARQPVGEAVAEDHERWLAIREGHLNAADAEYFTARPQLDNAHNHRIFYAGFCKGYDASPAPQAAQAEQAEAPSEAEHIHLAWRGALKACGVGEADRNAISEVVLSMLPTQPTASNAGEREASIEQKVNRVTVVLDNEVVGSFAGPKCMEHAALFRAAISLPRSAGDGWISVLDELPPDREMVAVGWMDVEDHDHADRYSIDYLEEGVWQLYFSEHEHYLIAGVARGNSEDAPYTHWQRIGTLPHSPQTRLARAALATKPPAGEQKPVEQDSQAARDVLAERERQKSVEGWTPEHDDSHRHGDLSTAAACYAMMGRYHYPIAGSPPPQWPWDAEWWKPSTYRRNLEKAGALILAEIERLDRAARTRGEQGGAV